MSESESTTLEVFLMNGDIIGAVRPDDDFLLLRRVRMADALAEIRLTALTKVADAGQSVFGILLDEVDNSVIEPILFERFRDNLVAFLASETPPDFEPMAGVFVDNMQMGHNAARLIDSACKDADLARRHPPETLLTQGPAGARDDVETAILMALGDDEISITQLIERSPVEWWGGRAIIAGMLDSGALSKVGDPEEFATVELDTGDIEPLPEVDVEPIEEPVVLDEPELVEEPEIPEEPVVLDEPAPFDDPAPPDEPDPIEEPVALDAIPPIDPDTYEEAETVEELAPVVDPAPPEDPLLDEEPTLRPEPAVPPPDLEDDGELDPSLLDEPPPEEEGGEPASPEEIARWLDTGEHISDEDMAFFEDHENDRGAGEGGFSTELHNLDKVDVTDAAEMPNQVIEADEAPAAKFSAPVLSEREALEKIEVCNDVLRRIAEAFDDAAGPGRGRTQMQLLVDGAPSKYTALLHDLTVLDNGELPAEDLLDNLAGRPPSEHRQLINSALKNVIERALSSAADDLPEDSFDDVYESVAGYNKRLGL
ncbi:MAG: hypothetical protein H6737_07750 [Alphaproteobacteria bacterium]|nr:hypothetical protein [Alphaproteobacteria bacterium]